MKNLSVNIEGGLSNARVAVVRLQTSDEFDSVTNVDQVKLIARQHKVSPAAPLSGLDNARNLFYNQTAGFPNNFDKSVSFSLSV